MSEILICFHCKKKKMEPIIFSHAEVKKKIYVGICKACGTISMPAFNAHTAKTYMKTGVYAYPGIRDAIESLNENSVIIDEKKEELH